MDQTTQVSGIIRAKELLKTIRHACMATVNQDGTLHNTPFVLLYDAVEHGGLYIKIKDAHALEGKEVETALEIHNQKRQNEAKTP